MRKTNGAGRRSAARREGGFSIAELLLITVPLCALSMIATSKLAATSRDRARAQWQATLSAQQSATNLCGGNDDLNGPWQNAKARAKVHQIHGISTPPGLDQTANANTALQGQTTATELTSTLAHITKVGQIVSDTDLSMRELRDRISATSNFPTDLLQQSRLTDTNWSVKNAQATTANNYYYKAAADQLIPDSKTSTAPTAAVICRDPDAGLGTDELRTQLQVWAFDQAGKFY